MKFPSWLVDDKGNSNSPPSEQQKVVQLNKPLPAAQVQYSPLQETNPTPTISTGVMDEKQHMKWNTFFITLLDQKADQKYRQFTKVVEGMGNSVPENVRCSSAFLGLKAMGLTKQALLDGANATTQVLNTDADTFKKQMDDRHQKEVVDPQALVADKQQQIQKLQQEIIDLNNAAATADAKISMSILGYSTYFKQAQAKVGNDITSITNYIQE